jgi:hypothetical protein
MSRVITVLLVLSLAGCGVGRPGTVEECLSTYAKTGATEQLVRAGYGWCRTAFDPANHPLLQARARCVVEQIPDLKAAAALSVVRNECTATWPTPACSDGQEFSFERDECIAVCRKPDTLSEDGKTCQENPFTKYDAEPPAGFVLDNPPPPPQGFEPVK